MSRIILVRHGETEWNRQEIFRGRIDVALNQTGRRQAEATGKALESTPIEVLYTSPLSRARETAEGIVRVRKVPLVEEEAFTDIHFGEWQGRLLSEVKEECRDLYAAWQTVPQTVRFPGGESLEDVKERCVRALQRLATKHRDETIGIVSHRVVCKVMILSILALPLERFWDIRQDTCAVNIFAYRDGRWIIEILNDTCHVRGLKAERLGDF